VTDDEYQRFLKRHEKRPIKKEKPFNLWDTLKALKKWIFFFIVHAVISNGRK
jgi:hypothetical protein